MLFHCSDLHAKSIGNKDCFGEDMLETANMLSYSHYIWESFPINLLEIKKHIGSKDIHLGASKLNKSSNIRSKWRRNSKWIGNNMKISLKNILCPNHRVISKIGFRERMTMEKLIGPILLHLSHKWSTLVKRSFKWIRSTWEQKHRQNSTRICLTYKKDDL